MIFSLTYLALALGKVPGLRIDRAGIALVGLATASNVGSVATITGNPQNIIIGSLSHIAYLQFAARLAPVALIGLALNFAVVALVYRKTLGEAGPDPPPVDELSRPQVHR